MASKKRKRIFILTLMVAALVLGVVWLKTFTFWTGPEPHRKLIIRSLASVVEDHSPGPILLIGNSLRFKWTDSYFEASASNEFIEDKISQLIKEKVLSHLTNYRTFIHPQIKTHIVLDQLRSQHITSEIEIQLGISELPITTRLTCLARFTWYLSDSDLSNVSLNLLQDRQPVKSCELSGDVGRALEFGNLVQLELNSKFQQSAFSQKQLPLSQMIFEQTDLLSRLEQMDWVNALLPSMKIQLRQDLVLNNPAVVIRISWDDWEHQNYLSSLDSNLETSLLSDYELPSLNKQFSGPICNFQGLALPSFENCETGDMNLFAGLLCSVGMESACQMTELAQDSKGQWWRSPQRKGQEKEYHEFSPDMFLGTVLYLTKVDNPHAFEKWLDFIKGNISQLSQNTHLYRFCKNDLDGTCNLLGNEWMLLNRLAVLYQRKDLIPLDTSESYKADTAWLPVQALVNQRGFRMHLIAVQIYILKLMMQKDVELFSAADIENIQTASGRLLAREPRNAFFRYLHFGADNVTKKLFEEACLSESLIDKHKYRDWIWQRSFKESVPPDSSGWDCYFMSKLLEH